MKIVVLTGSPHHPGTSEQLADAFVKGAIEAGNEVYRFDAGRRTDEFSMIKLEDNHPGQEVAIEPNDIVTNEVMPKLLAADMVVLVSSLYYYGINAALKSVIDRFYSYNHDLHGGKKAITLVSGYGQEDAFASLNLYFDQLLNYMRWNKVGSVLAADSWNEQKLAKHVAEAYDLGQSI
ncbi:flavodoxin family protein [Limosilactobacillus walteri]|uniref:Flavodoxin family protein n=1 Tax=Limosilactobacillus walteri TaxID=2268022 RepID=A0ABR8P964_9LACO|nr:flavodoxin family protein [Limosilactobacillus walteri]MBD5807281.1 flavodoxin family protein [Limosilactobacillus walteri]